MISILKRRLVFYLFSFWVIFWTGIVQASPPLPVIAEHLQQRLQFEPYLQKPTIGDSELHSPALSERFYAQREYRPVWLNDTGPLPTATTLLEVIRDARSEALRPSDYHREELDRLLIMAQEPTALSTSQWAELDLLLTDAWLTYGSHLLSGRFNPKEVTEQWKIQGRSRDLVKILQEAVQSNSIKEALYALRPPHPGYDRLRSALTYYRGLSRTGGWTTITSGPTLKKGDTHPRVTELRRRLRITGDLAEAIVFTDAVASQQSITAVDSADSADLSTSNGNEATTSASFTGTPDMVFDEVIFEAVRRFQRRHGLADDGIVGPRTQAALNVPPWERIRQIELNLERWRWLPEDLGNRYILVNITDFTMTVVENGRLIMESKAVVGMADRPTPVLSASMSYLVMSPRWYVPRSIAVKDKLPRLRKNPYAFSRQGMRIYNASGQEIDPGTVDWQTVSANNFPYRLRQDPGPHNALGSIKFIFPNPYNVYLHDTPSTHLFNRDQRSYSSGCIRISKPFELAEYLLKGNSQWNRDAIVSASKGRRERRVDLPEKIPVYLFYWTAWVDDKGTIHFRRDIYNRDQRLARVFSSDFRSDA